MSNKTGIILALALCAAALVYSIGSRLSSEAINVLLGVTCGVGASIPVSLGLLMALLRRRREREEEEADDEGYPEPASYYPARPARPVYPAQPGYPPIIVVAPPQQPTPPGYPSLPSGYSMHEPPAARDFKIIGEDDDTLDA